MLTPYVIYAGNAEEALNFYAVVFGGTVTQTGRYGVSPMPVDEDYKDKIIHARLERRMKQLFISLVFTFSFFSCAWSQKAGEQEAVVMAKMDSLKIALISKDSVVLYSLLAPDVSYGHSNGMIQTREQLIADLMSGVQDYKSIESSNISTSITESAAIVTTNTRVSMLFNTKRLELKMKILLVWIKRNGEWKLAARQSVSVTER